jgi:hypothetical protein
MRHIMLLAAFLGGCQQLSLTAASYNRMLVIAMWTLWMSSLIVVNRIPRLAQEAHRLVLGRVPDGRFESERMVTEKVLAVQGGMVAANLEGIRISVEIATRMAFGDVHSASNAVASAPMRIARAAAQPTHRTVADNARRLSGG